MQRIHLVAFAALIPLLGATQDRTGITRRAPAPTDWRITSGGALAWSRSPWVPIGAAVEPTPDVIGRAVTAGVRDFLVDLPRTREGWDAALGALDKANANYLVRISSLAPTARGVVVEPQGYRIAGIEGPRPITVRLPGATSAMVVLAAQRDGEIAVAKRVPVQNGLLLYEAAPPGPGAYVLLIYPVTDANQFPDFWEGLDAHRDQLLTTLRSAPLGNGLRGLVNPLGRTLELPGRELRFVPTSRIFQMELASVLEEKYRNVETAMRAWGMGTNDLSVANARDVGDTNTVLKGTFDDLARMVPLWNGSRGVGRLWDPKTDLLYPVDQRRSEIWRDLTETVLASSIRRTTRLVEAIRQATGLPVVQEWVGTSSVTERENNNFDGLAVNLRGTTPSQIGEQAGRALGTAARWTGSPWRVGIWSGWEPVQGAPGLIADSAFSLGLRGAFFEASTDAQFKAIAEAAKGRDDASLAEFQPRALFFPENAWNPAFVSRLPGGRIWLPTPADGDRLDFGGGFAGYRTRRGAQTETVIWTTAPGKVRFRSARPKDWVITSLDGLDTKPRLVKEGFEIEMGTAPIIFSGPDEIPIPEAALLDTIARFKTLTSGAQEQRRDPTEDRVAFDRALNQLNTNPGGTFLLLRTFYYRAAQALGTFTWIEAESSSDHNFSEIRSVAGNSGTGSLILRTPLSSEGAYSARYTVQARTSAEQQVWVAMRIPEELRNGFSLRIGSQILRIEQGPIGPYGAGLAWYRLGTTRIAGVPTPLTISVVAPEGADMAIDAILLTPGEFAPQGPVPPEPVLQNVGPVRLPPGSSSGGGSGGGSRRG